MGITVLLFYLLTYLLAYLLTVVSHTYDFCVIYYRIYQVRQNEVAP